MRRINNCHHDKQTPNPSQKIQKTEENTKKGNFVSEQ